MEHKGLILLQQLEIGTCLAELRFGVIVHVLGQLNQLFITQLDRVRQKA